MRAEFQESAESEVALSQYPQSIFYFDLESIEAVPGLHQQEIGVAIFDLNDDLDKINQFFVIDQPSLDGYKVVLSKRKGESLLTFDIFNKESQYLLSKDLGLGFFRKNLADYDAIVTSYKAVALEGNPDKIEALDEERKALHNGFADRVIERLKGKGLVVDHHTARMFVTLMYSLKLTRSCAPDEGMPVIDLQKAINSTRISRVNLIMPNAASPSPHAQNGTARVACAP